MKKLGMGKKDLALRAGSASRARLFFKSALVCSFLTGLGLQNWIRKSLSGEVVALRPEVLKQCIRVRTSGRRMIEGYRRAKIFFPRGTKNWEWEKRIWRFAPDPRAELAYFSKVHSHVCCLPTPVFKIGPQIFDADRGPRMHTGVRTCGERPSEYD